MTSFANDIAPLFRPRDVDAMRFAMDLSSYADVRDNAQVIYERLADGTMPKVRQMQFMPNTGYAFAVKGDSWHSADPVDTGNRSRDSILLTYFVDSGVMRVARNRGKRIGNFILDVVPLRR